MQNAIGMIESISIAKGIEITDAMLKAASVKLIIAKPICAGKFITLVKGEVAAVEASVEVGNKIGDRFVIDTFVIANVHPSVFPALNATSEIKEIEALGVLETYSLAILVKAADACAKAANVQLIELRLAVGLGGKAYLTLTGDVAAVKASLDVGSLICEETGMLITKVLIPAPSKEICDALL